MGRSDLHISPQGWLFSPVAGCSLAAQGLFLRLCLIAHCSDNRGYLEGDLCRLCGSPKNFSPVMAEIEAAGLLGKDEKGTFVRMFANEKSMSPGAIRSRRHREKRLAERSGDVPQNGHETPAKRNGHEETQRQKSVSSKTMDIESLLFPDSLNNHECKTIVDRFLTYRIETKRPYKSVDSVNTFLKRWGKYGRELFVNAVEKAIANGWQAPVEPEDRRTSLFSEKKKPSQNIPSPDDILFQQQFRIGGEEWCRIVEENHDLEAYKFNRRRQNGFA